MPFSRGGTPSHSALPGVTTAQHHTATVAGDIDLADLNERLHGSLATVTSDQHHADAHTVASHSDTSGTGAELNTLTDGSTTDLHVHTQNARIATGSYTGDGELLQEVTGVGFQVVFLILSLRVTGDSGLSNRGTDFTWTTMIDNNANGSMVGWVGTERLENLIDGIIALDTDGFSIDDADVNAHPNMNGEVYDFVAIG